ncbi:hypothetical protein C7H19_15240 [Aphanothece hegewaldii CCALA 016]|uniref:Uncharacterized protein n=1 Tax=Aphanothece hegewaldii CCALA 016 TaxID=2107694 RepID=A0A2T1LVM0_9CHRO|nr:hypothetical protein [Aphanothece hegewaldii]PSF35778.1 hypothetical protein C7H19_15240 [Aphanothece hegewaldii CCALA 016]
MERLALYEKFMILDWRQQLGNLASTLATISTQVNEPTQDRLTDLLLREAALMSEWCVKNVPEPFHLELASIQRECLAWKRRFPIEEARSLLSLSTRHQSERILQLTRLLDSQDLLQAHL